MIIKNLKIQMLAGNSLKMCVGVGFEISLTLVNYFNTYVLLKVSEYNIVGRASSELINQIAMIAPRITHRDNLGLRGYIIALYLWEIKYHILYYR